MPEYAQKGKAAQISSKNGVVQRKPAKSAQNSSFSGSESGAGKDLVPTLQLSDHHDCTLADEHHFLDFSRIPVVDRGCKTMLQSSETSNWPIQAKVIVNQPGDRYEQEADRIAERIINAPAYAALNRMPTGVQNFAGQPSGQIYTALKSVNKVLESPGRPLQPALRQEMEQRFGHDFSRVRVHSDADAEKSAREVNAHAYTVGKDIAFGAGRFSPETHEGRRLIAHELTHVVQQSGFCGVNSECEKATRLMRQPATSGSAAGNIYHYDRSNFSGLYDGQVNDRSRTVMLTMRLAINDAVGADAPDVKAARISSFFLEAQAAIERAWRNSSYVLKSICGSHIYSVIVNVLLDYSNPHQTITLWAAQGERNKSTNWQLDSTRAKTRTSPVPIDPNKPPSSRNIRDSDFSQVPVVHEFGHLMGLEHPLCSGNEDRCYGVTFEQKNDIMGYGSEITPRDYQPFIVIMERYGQDHLPKECNTWQTAV